MIDYSDYSFQLFSLCNLQNNVDNYDQERICQVEQKPHLHRFNVWSAWQRVGHREVYRGQNHQTCNVDGVDHVILGVSNDVISGLVDDVHEYCG